MSPTSLGETPDKSAYPAFTIDVIKLNIQEPTFLSSVVESYAREIVDFMRVIQETAAAAGYPPEDYIPPVIQNEYERVGTCARIVARGSADIG